MIINKVLAEVLVCVLGSVFGDSLSGPVLLGNEVSGFGFSSYGPSADATARRSLPSARSICRWLCIEITFQQSQTQV